MADAITRLTDVVESGAIPGPLVDDLRALLTRLRTAEAERDEASAAIVRLESLDVKAERGKPWSASAGFGGHAVELFAAEICAFYEANGGKNYVEMHLRNPNKPTDAYVVTVQRLLGKSPDALRKEAEAERDALRSCIQSVTGATWCDVRRQYEVPGDPSPVMVHSLCAALAAWRRQILAERDDALAEVSRLREEFRSVNDASDVERRYEAALAWLKQHNHSLLVTADGRWWVPDFAPAADPYTAIDNARREAR